MLSTLYKRKGRIRANVGDKVKVTPLRLTPCKACDVAPAWYQSLCRECYALREAGIDSDVAITFESFAVAYANAKGI